MLSKFSIRLSFLNISLILCGFLASQRYLLPNVSSHIFMLVLTLGLFYLYKSRRDDGISFIILSMFYAVDNGASVYTETNSILLNVVYLITLLIFVYSYKLCVSRNKIFYVIALVFFVFLGILRTKMVYQLPIDYSTLKRDLLLLFILILTVFKPKKCNSLYILFL